MNAIDATREITVAVVRGKEQPFRIEQARIRGPRSDVPVVGVAAAGAAQDETGGHDPARYNLFRIDRVGRAWQCTMREFGFQRLSSEIVLRLSVRIY